MRVLRVLVLLGVEDGGGPVGEREGDAVGEGGEEVVRATADVEPALAVGFGFDAAGEVAAEGEEGAVERERVGVAGRVALVPVEPAPLERGRVLRVGHLAAEAGEVLELRLPARAHERAELGVVIGEELERRGRGPLLAHEQERQLGREEQERARRAVRAGSADVVSRSPAGPVADLVVVLDADDALLGADRLGARPAWLARRFARAAVVEPPALERLRDVGRRRVGEVGVVALGVASEEVADQVVEVVGPDGVEAVAVGAREDERVQVAVVLGDERARADLGAPRRPRDSSARRCGSESSTSACVASRRRPSRWYSRSQWSALSRMKSRTPRLPASSRLIASPHGVRCLSVKTGPKAARYAPSGPRWL